jgi:hypothetical protein
MDLSSKAVAWSTDPFDGHRHALANPDAHGGESVATMPAVQFLDSRASGFVVVSVWQVAVLI